MHYILVAYFIPPGLCLLLHSPEIAPPSPPIVVLCVRESPSFLLYSLVCCIFLDSIYKWYNSICIFLTYFVFIHVVANGKSPFFLWLNSIPLYVYTPHLFLHSSVNRHFNCFPVLAIVFKAAMNIGAHVPFQIRVFVFRKFLSSWSSFLRVSSLPAPKGSPDGGSIHQWVLLSSIIPKWRNGGF